MAAKRAKLSVLPDLDEVRAASKPRKEFLKSFRNGCDSARKLQVSFSKLRELLHCVCPICHLISTSMLNRH